MESLYQRVLLAFQTDKASVVARKLGLSVQALYKWRDEKAIPDGNTLLQIYRETDRSVHWILTGEGPEVIENPINKNQKQEPVNQVFTAETVTFNKRANLVAGDMVNVEKYSPKTVIAREPDDITEAQAQKLLEYLNKLGGLESKRTNKNGFKLIQGRFKKRFGLASYRKLKAEDFDTAVGWLKQQTAMVEKTLAGQGIQTVTAEEYKKRIFGICRSIGWTDPDRRKYMGERFGKFHINELDMVELEKFYLYLTDLKTKTTKASKTTKKNQE